MIKQMKVFKCLPVLAVLWFSAGTVFADRNVTPEQGASLRIWATDQKSGKTLSELDFLKYAARQFQKKYPSVRFKFSAVQHTQAPKNLLLDPSPANGAADVFTMPHDHLGELVNSGTIAKNLVSPDRVRREMMPVAFQAASRNGIVYGYPLSIETYIFFYNKKYLPRGVRSFEELMQKTKSFVSQRKKQYGIFFEASNFYYSYAFMSMYGAYTFGKNGTDDSTVGFASPAALKGYRNLLKLRKIMPVSANDTGYQQMMGFFREGKSLSMINGPWAVADVKDMENRGMKIGVSELPSFDGQKLHSFAGVKMLGVNQYSAYPRAAQMFAKFATSDAMMLKRYEMVKQIPVSLKLLSSPLIARDKFNSAILKQARYARSIPSIPATNFMWSPMQAAVRDAWDNKMSLEKALGNAETQIKEQITNIRKN